MTIELTDRENQTLLVALEHLRTQLAQNIASTATASKINQYDILDRKHTLMHTITLMSKLTKKPVATFMGIHPSQPATPTNQAA